MRKVSRPRVSELAIRRPDVPWIDRLGFSVFVGCTVLVFTTAIPDQFALPKVLGLYAYAAFAATRWALDLGRGRVRELPRAAALVTAAMAGWWIVTTLTAQHVPTALFGMRGRYNGLATMLAGLAVFLFLATTRMPELEIQRRLGTLGVALTLAAGYAFVQEAGLDPIPFPVGRPASTVGHPVIFAGALAMVVPFLLVFALAGRSRRVRLAWGAMWALQVLALALTLARGPWIGAACGLLTFATLAAGRRDALARRLAGLFAGAALLVAGVLALAPPIRAAVLGRASTLFGLGADSSLAFRALFCRAAFAMWREHPLVGVGWENFGLLYPAYRSPVAASIGPDVVPMMVHSGPVQTAVSGGAPALLLQFVFFFGIAGAVLRRWHGETDPRQRLFGAAFAAALVAYFVEDLSGWPHVALGALSWVVWGLAMSWSLEGAPPAPARARWPLAVLGVAIAVGGGWLSLDAWRRVRAERLVLEAQRLDAGGSWFTAQTRLRAALALSPDRAWVNDAAARLYAHRASAGDRGAYERGIALANAASAANPYDSSLRLRRTELDLVALEHGLLARVTDEGRDALEAARSMDASSAAVRKAEASLARRAGGSRIASMAPRSVAGFGPEGGLIVAGSTEAPAGTRVFLHWRNATRKSSWGASADAAVSDAAGAWFNAIPNAALGERYEAYATFEMRPYGACTYGGAGVLSLCAPVAWIGPRKVAGFGPPGSLIVAGSAPAVPAGTRAALHWRQAGARADWAIEAYGPVPGVPGAWYGAIPNADPSVRYQAYLTVAGSSSPTCTYDGRGALTFCAPTIWIRPRADAGFGPAGSLVVAGWAPGALAGIPVFLHWRNVTRGSPWALETYAPAPDASGVWYNFIPNADPGEQYQVYLTSATISTATCAYAGDGTRNLCR